MGLIPLVSLFSRALILQPCLCFYFVLSHIGNGVPTRVWSAVTLILIREVDVIHHIHSGFPCGLTHSCLSHGLGWLQHSNHFLSHLHIHSSTISYLYFYFSTHWDSFSAPQVPMFVHNLSISLSLPVFPPFIDCLCWPNGWWFWGWWLQRQGAEQGEKKDKRWQEMN